MSRVSVGKIPEPNDVIAIGRIYAEIEKMLKREFRILTPLEFDELKSMEFKKRVEGLIQKLNRESLKWSTKAGIDAYIDAKDKASLLLEIIGAKADRLFDERIHKNEIRSGIEKTNEVLLKANISINMTAEMFVYLIRQSAAKISTSFDIQAWDMRDEEVIADLLDEALAMGASAWKVSKMVMAHFEELIGEGQFITINGRNYNLKKYSKMVARTRLRKMQSQAVLKSCKEYNNDLVQISDHGTQTPICLPYEGNVYSVSGKSADYPVLPDTPPFHPNCMHNMSPTSIAILERKGM